MRHSLLPLLPILLPSSVTALPSWQPWNNPANPAPSSLPQSQNPQALYTMTNDVTGNTVIAIPLDSNGMPSSSSGSSTVKYYSTGGVGGNYVSPVDGAPHFPDALSAQDAMVVAGDYLFAVNAGSNTVTMFLISANDPTQLTMLGSPSPSNGDFPTTLAASLTHMQICVGNTGATSGISCSSFSSSNGIAGFDTLRAMNVGETVTPPTGPTPGYGDILFSEDQDMLLVLVKGNGTEFEGYAATFPVGSDGTVSATVSDMGTPPGSKALFGTATIPGSATTVLTSDAGLGGLLLDITDLSSPPLAIINVTGQAASCWAQVSASGRGFITDAAVNRLVEVSTATGAIVKEYYPPTSFGGMTDFVIAGEYMWALSASNGSYATSVTGFDIAGGVGSIEYMGVYVVPGAGENTQGLCWY